MKEVSDNFNLEEYYLELKKEVEREFNVVDNAKVMILGIGDAITSVLNLIRMNQNEIYKNHLKYSFISTGSTAINNFLGKIKFPKSQKTNYYTDIDYLEIGRNITDGLGARGEPETALKAFADGEKEIDEFLNKELDGIELVIIIAALGGGTGTAITPLINKKIKNMNIPVINVISLPFEWEGKKRSLTAAEYIPKFYETADKVITINSNELLNRVEKVMKRKLGITRHYNFISYT